MRQTITPSQEPVADRDGALLASQLEHVLDGVADGVVLTSGGRSRLNQAAKRMLGVADGADFHTSMFSPRSLEGARFEIPPDSLPGETALAHGGGGGRFRIRVTTLDQRELVVDGSVSPVDDGTVIVFRDVTDEQAQVELNEQTLKALFDAIPVAINVADSKTGEVVTANRAFAELVGLRLEDIVGVSPPYPWWEPGEAAEDFLPGARFERVFRRPDGWPRPVHVSLHGINGEAGESGETALILRVVQDISGERRVQQQLVQSGKLAAIGELAAGVAHEINNPLFAILGLTEFLLKEADPGSKARSRLELIQQTGLEIKEIVRALLDFARENAEERHVVLMEDVVQSTVDLIRRTNSHKGVEIRDSYDESCGHINASPNQLKQIFLNLIANARQAMPNGGTVEIDVRRDGEFVLTTVRDDGPGIEPELIERIFEPFFTTKRSSGGTGLGLSVSLGIAESHGGTLTVSSEIGHGTEFALRLPVVPEEVPA
jgi:PAS domain S-box-containing protein